MAETTEILETKKLVSTQRLLLYDEQHPLRLACGRKLAPVEVAFETYGQLNEAKDNVILVVHALTGSAHAAFWHTEVDREPGWWHGMIGPGKALDTDRYFVICSNLLGSCYGTTGPTSWMPGSDQIYGENFPPITTADMVTVQKALLDHLGVRKVKAIIGGSLGGMVTWQFGVQYPDLAEALIPIAGTPEASPWVIALNEVARQAILLDPDHQALQFQNGQWLPKNGAGLKLARMIAMISYRSEMSFAARFGRERLFQDPDANFDASNRFQVENYLHYQGEKLLRRFDPYTYLTLTRAMDWHSIHQGATGGRSAWQAFQAAVLCIGIDTDRLFPAFEMQAACRHLLQAGIQAEYAELHSPHGHDAFLIEFEQLNQIVGDFLRRRSR